MSVRESRPVWGLVVLAVSLAVAARAQAASEGGCQVTLTVKKTGEEPVLGTWVNGSGPTDLFLTTDVSYTFTGSCSCGHSVSLSSCTSIGKSAGPSAPASFEHTFTTASSSTNDLWVKCTCPVEDPDKESNGTFTVLEMELSQTGRTIEAANSYSENAEIRLTAVFADATCCYDFNGTVNLAEDGTAIYSQNGGTLPASVTIENGYEDFDAKSIAGAKTPFLAKPDPAKIKTTNYSVYSIASLPILQWLDENSNQRVDWCEDWVDDLLEEYQGSGGELGIVTGRVSYVAADSYTANTYGQMQAWGSYAFWINPAATKHRTNGDSYLMDTVLHESRHVFVDWDCHRSVGTDNGAGPDNDDDEGTGDKAPELVYLASETGTTGVRDGVDVGTGDGTADNYAQVVLPALEADAVDFADDYAE